MEVHPRIRQRIAENMFNKELEIQGRRITAVAKLNSVLRYLRSANILSEAIDVDDLIAEIEQVRGAFISFQIDAENPASIRDAIAPRINRIHEKLKRLEVEQEAETMVAPGA